MTVRPPLQIEMDGTLPGTSGALQLTVSHGKLLLVVGEPGSGKSCMRRAVQRTIDQQYKLLDQLAGSVPLSSALEVSGPTRVTNALPYHVIDGAVQYRSSRTIADVLFSTPDQSARTTGNCPDCDSADTIEFSLESFTDWLIEAHAPCPVSICRAYILDAPCSFVSTDSLYDWLKERSVTGRSRIRLNDANLDLDDPAETEHAFPVTAHQSLEVVFDRVILNQQQQARVRTALQAASAGNSPVTVRGEKTFTLLPEANAFCRDCGTTFQATTDIPATVQLVDALASSEPALALLKQSDVPPELLQALLTQPVASLSPAAFQFIQMLAILVNQESQKLLLFDHSPVCTFEQRPGTVEYFFGVVAERGNTTLFFAPYVPAVLPEGTEMQLLPSRKDARPMSATLPRTEAQLKSNGVFLFAESDPSYQGLAQEGRLFAVTDVDGSVDLLSEQNEASSIPVQFHSLQLASSDGSKKVLSIPGFSKGLCALFEKLPAARKHGLLSKDFAAVLPGDDASPLPDSIRYRGYSINEITSRSVLAAWELLQNIPACSLPLQGLVAAGLGYVTLDQELYTLSYTEQITFSLVRLILRVKKKSVVIVPDISHLVRPAALSEIMSSLSQLCLSRSVTILVVTRQTVVA